MNRFIPTCVGQIPSPAPATITRPVHPHVRGANSKTSDLTNDSGGSSPREWG